MVIDEKEITIPKPGVWDSPNLPLPPPKKPSLTEALKNACTVEELERGLISNRAPPGLTKPAQNLSNNSGNLFFNSGLCNEKIQQINGTSLPNQNNQHPIIYNQTLRLPHPQFHIQNVKSMQSKLKSNKIIYIFIQILLIFYSYLQINHVGIQIFLLCILHHLHIC